VKSVHKNGCILCFYSLIFTNISTTSISSKSIQPATLHIIEQISGSLLEIVPAAAAAFEHANSIRYLLLAALEIHFIKRKGIAIYKLFPVDIVHTLN
jgi:hypothetical protein